ncbi:YetF domain-containing protein [Bacillus sp. es.036]|uniref:YetF domain-containing protein n=1 Tax=Bacillus sp. es.036 TaxID=1761764 RepID=UPI000BF53C20|nr:DUF421 domain-containing protein [Bacillus sp. es.036]PFG12204.1 uncharacterized membrane protein YcaP (DUF421 family) [Bacillus sp. es.036]
MALTTLLIRLSLSFITLLLLTRIMGRKEISQMTFFNFVSAIALGTLGASLAIDSSLSVRNGMIALVAWTLFTILMGYADLKSKTMRLGVKGSPKIVVRNGKIMENELRKLRLDLDSLNLLLRKKNVFSLKDVDYAIFETDGTLSVLKKDNKQPVTKGDQGITSKAQKIYPISAPLIEDGQLNRKSLNEMNVDEGWLLQQVQAKGIQSVSDVFYAELQKDGSLFIDKRDDRLH